MNIACPAHFRWTTAFEKMWEIALPESAPRYLKKTCWFLWLINLKRSACLCIMLEKNVERCDFKFLALQTQFIVFSLVRFWFKIRDKFNSDVLHPFLAQKHLPNWNSPCLTQFFQKLKDVFDLYLPHISKKFHQQGNLTWKNFKKNLIFSTANFTIAIKKISKVFTSNSKENFF